MPWLHRLNPWARCAALERELAALRADMAARDERHLAALRELKGLVDRRHSLAKVSGRRKR